MFRIRLGKLRFCVASRPNDFIHRRSMALPRLFVRRYFYTFVLVHWTGKPDYYSCLLSSYLLLYFLFLSLLSIFINFISSNVNTILTKIFDTHFFRFTFEHQSMWCIVWLFRFLTTAHNVRRTTVRNIHVLAYIFIMYLTLMLTAKPLGFRLSHES